MPTFTEQRILKQVTTLPAQSAVTGTKDATDSDGKPLYQQMDNSACVPDLVAAIKELHAYVELLTTRIEHLEAAHP